VKPSYGAKATADLLYSGTDETPVSQFDQTKSINFASAAENSHVLFALKNLRTSSLEIGIV
jgi:hypothetical protein